MGRSPCPRKASGSNGPAKVDTNHTISGAPTKDDYKIGEVHFIIVFLI